MLDGASISTDYTKIEVGGSLLINSNVNFGSGGMLRIFNGVGTLHMPAEGPEPGVWFAAGPGSKSITKNGHSGFVIKGLTRLGTCATATGTGDLAFCDDTNGSCPGGMTPTATGTVNGTDFDWGGHPNFSFYHVSSYSVAVLWKSGAALFGQIQGSSKIQNGILWMPSGPPDDHAFWCAEAGSAVAPFGGATNINVSQLKRLGTAAEGVAVAGQIDGCY